MCALVTLRAQALPTRDHSALEGLQRGCQQSFTRFSALASRSRLLRRTHMP